MNNINNNIINNKNNNNSNNKKKKIIIIIIIIVIIAWVCPEENLEIPFTISTNKTSIVTKQSYFSMCL